MLVNKYEISACFCEIPLRKLVKLVHMRFLDGTSTQELMMKMESARDREYLATVALLDVSEKDLIEMADQENPSELRHLLACRLRTLEILERHKLPIKGHAQNGK